MVAILDGRLPRPQAAPSGFGRLSFRNDDPAVRKQMLAGIGLQASR
jgi:hypothetical protein